MPSITQFFGVGLTPGESNTLNHSLSTAVIGADGTPLAWYPSNEWTPAEIVDVVKKAAS